MGIAEELRDEARKLIKDNQRLVAPDLIFPEIANICWKKNARNEIGSDQAKLILALTRQIIPSIIATNFMAERAFEIAAALGHPAYDGFYLAAAEIENAILITADQKLARKVANTDFARFVCFLGASDMEHRISGHASHISKEKLEELILIVASAQKTKESLANHFNPDKLRLRQITRSEQKMIDGSSTIRRVLHFLTDLTLSERTDLMALLWSARDALRRSPTTEHRWYERRGEAQSAADNIEYLLGYVLITDCLTKALEIMQSAGEEGT